jgi:hypothetical protein
MQLSTKERKDFLVRAGMGAQGRARARLVNQQIDQIRLGEMAPLTVDPNGVPYSDIGRKSAFREDNPLVDIGRLPLDDTVHLLQNKDGHITLIGGYGTKEDAESDAAKFVRDAMKLMSGNFVGEEE